MSLRTYAIAGLIVVSGLIGCDRAAKEHAPPVVSPPVASPPVAAGTPSASPTGDGLRDPLPHAMRERPRVRALAAPATTGDVLGITFDDLSFEMPPRTPFSPEMIGESVRRFFGKKVKIRGFIHPASALTEHGLKTFVLVRHDQYGSLIPTADAIVVVMSSDETTSFTVRPIAVEGTLTMRKNVEEDLGPPVVFQIDATRVE